MKASAIAFAELMLVSASLGHDDLWGLFFTALSIALMAIVLFGGINCLWTWFISVVGVTLTLFALPEAVNSLMSWVYGLIGAAIIWISLALSTIQKQHDSDEVIY